MRALRHGMVFWAAIAGLLGSSLTLAALARKNGSAGAGAQCGPAPERLVSSILSTDEILLSLVPPERMVAVGRFADDPHASYVAEAAGEVEERVVGDPEQLVALRPDCVVRDAFGRPEVTALLVRVGVPMSAVKSVNRIDDIRANVRTLGALVSEEADAEEMIARMDRSLARTRQRVTDLEPPSVLLYTRGYTAGSGTLFDEVLSVAGARNAAAEAELVGHAPVPVAELVRMDPDVILVSNYLADGRARDLTATPNVFQRRTFRGLTAVTTGRVYELPARELFTTSHFVADATASIARVLHPEEFADDP
ncbi:MAG: ABC transporter substrate-binding protein [Myxococcota bacterium]